MRYRVDQTPMAASDEARQLFGRAGLRTLEHFARALLPADAAELPDADETEVATAVARHAAGYPRPWRLALRALLWAWEFSSLVSHWLRPFSRLAEAERAAYLALAAGRSWRRSLLLPLKMLCVAAYTSHPRVGAALGFDGGCLDPAPARNGPRLSPITYPAIGGDVRLRADVVVVGSGAGGAVVAKELAERGVAVAVVEEGAYFTRGDFTGTLLARMERLYRDRGLTVALGRPPVLVPLGRAVGGTTVVNSGTCFRPPARTLRAWAEAWGAEDAQPDAMEAVFERVEATLHVQPVPEALLGANARVFRRGVTALGLHGEPIRRNIDGCHGCGVCAFGCPSDAKQAMHLSYLPRAEAAGARIYARCRVRRILQTNGRVTGIEADILAAAGPGMPEPVRGRLTVAADAVVLAAGAIHTPLLLMANGLAPRGGPVGRNLRVHPAVGVLAAFDEDLHAWRGTLQSFFMDDFQDSHGLLFEVTSPLPGFSAAGVPGVGAALAAGLAAYPRVASVGLFVADSSRGRVRRLPGGSALVSYQLNRHDLRRLAFGIEVAARVFFAAGAREVYPGIAGVPALHDPAAVDGLAERVRSASALSVMGFHPGGTAAMGADPASGAVDPEGESYALRGLYVADASILPGSAGVNPQITIMAMATRIAWRLATRLGAPREASDPEPRAQTAVDRRH
jgi:choline dehydrogenase-like flavoprotein